MPDSTELLHGEELSVSLTVKDIRASLAWYRDIAGFTVAEQFEREGALMAVSLRAGKARILITQDDGRAGADRVKGAGFSMQITTDQDIDALANAIKARGGGLDSEPADARWGQRFFRLHDPDGFKFTISSVRH